MAISTGLIAYYRCANGNDEKSTYNATLSGVTVTGSGNTATVGILPIALTTSRLPQVLQLTHPLELIPHRVGFTTSTTDRLTPAKQLRF